MKLREALNILEARKPMMQRLSDRALNSSPDYSKPLIIWKDKQIFDVFVSPCGCFEYDWVDAVDTYGIENVINLADYYRIHETEALIEDLRQKANEFLDAEIKAMNINDEVCRAAMRRIIFDISNRIDDSICQEINDERK